MTTLYNLFEIAANKYKSEKAILWKTSEIVHVNYEQLLEDTRSVADCLTELKAVSGFVGILADTSSWVCCVLLGVLKQQAAFTFLDPKAEYTWINNVIGKLNIRWIFTVTLYSGNAFLKNCANICRRVVLCGTEVEIWKVLSSPAEEFSKDNFAYSVQTSGTTGTPKIVKVPHKCIVPNILDIGAELGIQASDRVLLGTALTFDPSVVELFIALANGAAVVMPSAQEEATVLQTTPSLFFARYSQMSFPQLRCLLLGGEICPSHEVLLKHLRNFIVRPKVFSAYGITEVSCWASLRHLDLNASDLNTQHLGIPLSKTVMHVQDEEGNIISTGEGVMHIGSEERICVINDEMMADLPGTVFRTTGDIVKVCADGFYYMGRKDRIVKRWGRQIDLSRLEVTASQLVREAQFYALQEAYRLILVTSVPVQSYQFQRQLRSSLPDDHIPDAVIELNPFPLTSHGKIDAAVMRIKINSYLTEHGRKQNNSFQNILENIWYHVLGKEPTSEGFLQLGGSSLLALQLCSLLEMHLGILLTPNLLPALLTGSGASFREVLNILQNRGQDDKYSSHSGSFPGLESSMAKGDELKSSVYDKESAINNDKKIQTEPQSVDKTHHYVYHNKKLKTTDGPLQVSIQQTEHDRLHSLSTDSDINMKLLSECKYLYGTKSQKKFNVKLSETLNSSRASSNTKYSDLIAAKPTAPNTGTQNKGLFSSDDEIMQVEEMNKKRSKSLSVLFSKEGEEEMSWCSEQCSLVKYCIILSQCKGNVVKYAEVETSEKYNLSPIHRLSVSWKLYLNKCVDASPCVALYKSCLMVLIGSHSGQLAIVHGNGLIHSILQLPGRIESQVCIAPCGQQAFVGCYDGCMYGFDINSGIVLWKFATGSLVKSSPVLCCNGTAIVFGSYDHKLYCLQVQGGTKIWSSEVSSAGICASPCIDSRIKLIFVGTLNGTVAAVCENSGKIAWLHQLTTPVFSSAAVMHSYDTGSSKVIFAEVIGKVHCYIGFNGVKLWTLQAGGNIFSSFTIFNSESEGSVFNVASETFILFGCHDHKVYCINSCGDHLWTSSINSSVYATPFVFSWNNCGLVAAASTAGCVCILDIKSGKPLCQLDLPAEVFSSPVVCSNKLFIGCRDDYIYSIDLSEVTGSESF